MRIFSVAFLIGILFVLTLQRLPSVYGLTFAVILPLIIYIFLAKSLKKIFLIPLAIILGFAWVTWHADWRLRQVLPKSIENKDVEIQGIIISIPEQISGAQRFEFQINKLEYQNQTWPNPGRVRLLWENSPSALKVGDAWQLQVHLKRPHATFNPGSFDYEAWLFANNIRATGYVRTGNNALLYSHFYSQPLNRLRQNIAQFISARLQNDAAVGFISALTVGVRDQITSQQWQTLRDTGTNHLMAIAGLHIGLVASIVFFLTNFLWRRIFLISWMPAFAGMTKIPAQQVAAVAALLAALFYSALAGFSLPTQRAVIMLGIFLVTILLRRNLPPWHALLLALFIILILDPLIILSSSFWLSFGVVSLIIYGMSGRLHSDKWWLKWIKIQGIIAVGIIPLTLIFFQQVSLAGFVANMLAIPWIGFIILPLCLIGVLALLISSHFAALVFRLAAKLLNFFWPLLQKIATISWLQWHIAIPNFWILMASCLGILLILAPQGFPARWLGVIWILPVFFWQPAAPKTHEVWFTLLDVGQGLATVVRTQHHVLIYDTGPKFNDNFDMGNAVVVPYLRTLGLSHVDTLVISHRDNDHIGGATAVIAQTHVQQIISSVPQYFSKGTAIYCVQGQTWQWDGVNFEFLYPPPGTTNLDNDSSCVLKITTGTQSLLLTGDIERKSENYLIKTAAAALSANILVAPHHGSGTSSSPVFVQAVHPQYVLYPVGYLNRYKFPNPQVINRYAQIGAQQYNSAGDGALFFKFNDSGIQVPQSYRKIHRKFWNDG